MIAEVINEYKALTMHVTEIIEKTGYRVDFVCEKLGLSKPGFYKKRKSGNFSPDEMLTILQIIKAEDIEERLFVDVMEKSKLSGRLTEKETKTLFASIG
jgi:hypothetical protein